MLIAGPNLTIDRTLTIEELRPGEVLRFERVVVTPGGKGLNVARTSRALGHAAVLVSFLPGHTGAAAAALIGEEGVELVGVACSGELRSTAIVLEHGGRTTVLNEPGPAISGEDWDAYERELGARLGAHGILVCSGSVPPGSPADAYGRLTALARGAGLVSVVDASATTLSAALSAGPDVVVPNLGEAEEALGSSSGGEAVEAAGDALSRALAAAAALVERGAGAAVVTAAAAGAAVASHDASPEWLAAPPVAHVANPIGAGDVLTAALAVALERGEPLLQAARTGVAAASASVEHPTAGKLDVERARALAQEP